MDGFNTFAGSDISKANGSNQSYYIARWTMNEIYLPRIYSQCMWINDSNGSIPFGYFIQVNFTTSPCIINTSATHYQIDDGEILEVSGNLLNISGVEPETLHWVKFWNSTFQVTNKTGIRFLLGFPEGDNFTLNTASMDWYPYEPIDNNWANFTYDGNYMIRNKDSGQALAYNGNFNYKYIGEDDLLNLSVEFSILPSEEYIATQTPSDNSNLSSQNYIILETNISNYDSIWIDNMTYYINDTNIATVSVNESYNYTISDYGIWDWQTEICAFGYCNNESLISFFRQSYEPTYTITQWSPANESNYTRQNYVIFGANVSGIDGIDYMLYHLNGTIIANVSTNETFNYTLVDYGIFNWTVETCVNWYCIDTGYG
ncbi:MAG: hypothetical protein ABIJ08_01305, partial [Nanoarchaeota archaeon]